MIKRLLVALSGTPFNESAILHAVELATRHEAAVTGVTVVDLSKLANVGPVPVGASAAAQELIEHRLETTEQHINEAIARFESECVKAGLEHEAIRITADPIDTLCGLWRYCDLTVVELRGLFEYGAVHNPDDMVCKIITRGVRPIVAVAREYRRVRRVLVAYNGSMESAKAIKRFVQSRPWPDVETKIVSFDRARDGQELLKDAAGYFRSHGFAVETELIHGSPREHLLATAATWQADLLVMGSTSRARILKHLLGDTALTTIRDAEIPLYLTQ